jgi:SPP1 gp7 family putative phage head morphogenesis protein
VKFDLAAMTKRATNRRRAKITLRPIEPTASMAGDLYRAAYSPVIAAWQAATAVIAARYEAALPVVRDHRTIQLSGEIGKFTDSIFDLDSILAAIDASLQQLVIAITPRLRAWAAQAETWHRGRWSSAVLAGTGIDPQVMLGGSDVSETVSAFVSRNVQLIRSVSDDTRAKVADIVLRGYSTRTPLRTVAKEMADAVDMSRKRALRISVDQNSTLAARLDQARQQQAGITQFEWRSSHKLHARPWHAARDGKVYDWETREEVDGPDIIPPGDGCGEPPYCGCRARARIDLS